MSARPDWARRATARRDEDGVVLPAVIAILFVVGTLVFSMMTMSMVDTSRSGRTATRTELRAYAEAELDRVFALSASEPNLFVDFQSDPHNWFLDGNWYSPSDGRLWSCGTTSIVCVRTTLATRTLDSARRDALDLDGRVNEVLVQVEASARCESQTVSGGHTAARERCDAVMYQQRLRRRQFFDYVQFTDSEALAASMYPAGAATTEGTDAWARQECGVTDPADPSSPSKRGMARNARCEVVAYQSDSPDRVVGPIHTNDTTVWVCKTGTDNVRFNGRLTTTQFPQVTPIEIDADSRPAGVADPCAKTDPLAEFLPTDPPAVVSVLELPSSTDLLALGDIAAAGNSRVASSASVEINGSGLVVGGAPRRLPESGVLFVDGDVTLRQAAALSGALTIVAAGQVRIETDLTVTGIDGATSWDPEHVTTMAAAAGDNLLGVVAGGDIVVACIATGTGCESRTIHAVLMSNGGAIYSDGWNADLGNRVGAADPDLKLFGSLISKTRGVFGAYDPFDGTLTRGFRKDFVYDPRLRDAQPPYLLQPVRAAWERVDLSEVPTKSDGLG